MNFLSEAYPDPAAPGAALLIIEDGRKVHEECRGLSKLPMGDIITPSTNFRLASVAKQFTATAILILAQRGRLKLDERLPSLLPEFPAYASQITVRHLLHHISGLPDYEELLPADLTAPVRDADVVRILCEQSATYFPPGSQFKYSNSGYAVLAVIVERVSGFTFPQFLKDEIFNPLGMINTLAFVDEPGAPAVPNRAYGCKAVEGRYEHADQSMTSAVLGDGGIYCSLNDYAKWDTALRDATLLPQAVIEESMRPGKLADGSPAPYGFGWRLEDLHGLKIAYHPGGTTGFNHCVRRIPALGLTILLLANRSAAGSVELARSIEAAWLQKTA